jgi:hypothetical protein
MRLPRMTTMRWMVAVVLTTVLFGVTMRSQSFQRRAARHHGDRMAWLLIVHDAEKRRRETHGDSGDVASGAKPSEADEERENVARLRERAAYHAVMAEKYRHAARYPWLSVDPDPPVPE